MAAATALQLATAGSLAECTPPGPSPLTVPEFMSLLSDADEGNTLPAVQRIGEVFSNADALNDSFMATMRAGQPNCLSEQESCVNIEIMSMLYTKLQDTRAKAPSVAVSFDTAVSTLSSTLLVRAKTITHPRDLRLFYMLLENPLFLDPSFHPALLSLMKAIVRLPSSAHDILSNWYTKHTKAKFQQLVGVIQQFITIQLYSTRLIDDLAAATRTLNILYQANEKARFIPFTEFYNDAVNSEINLKDDYKRWKIMPVLDRTSFAFCLYPWILDPASKAKVLQIDSIVQMRNEFQEAIVRNLFMMGSASASPYLILKVRRDNLIQDTLTQLVGRGAELKKPLKVHFIGEEGVDEGGVQKEFFQLLLKQLFDPAYAMFIADEENRTFWFNVNSFETNLQFELIGLILGLAIYNGVILDVHFPMVVYKKLMDIPPTLQDIKDMNPALGRGLQQLLDFEGDVENTFLRTFQVSYEAFGEVKYADLKENGQNIPVTNENKQEYVDLYVKWFLTDSVESQFRAFYRGFHNVCGGDALKLFRHEELELLICGSPELDFVALEKHTLYDDGYTAESTVIKNFWSVVHEMTQEQKKRLLFFATGSDRAPIKGLASLGLVISRGGPDSDRLPSAHTCFNHMLLPEYSSREKLKERLLTAIENAEGFGLM
eukprot:GILK01004507.1.p1 GENE.GILK01004507.1~~GILK01004507.1.p1  ORF type:complete len:764 (-),score=138.27 GILK01004507.1:85-2061(-)